MFTLSNNSSLCSAKRLMLPRPSCVTTVASRTVPFSAIFATYILGTYNNNKSNNPLLDIFKLYRITI